MRSLMPNLTPEEMLTSYGSGTRPHNRE